MSTIINEGKTKFILETTDPNLCLIQSKDDITAGDGAKHDVIPDKGRIATQTTCNVFRLLKEAGVPVAFGARTSAVSFTAPVCEMIKLEVVIRREAHGSALKREPWLKKGQYFPKLKFELYLKTSDKLWGKTPIEADDPYINVINYTFRLHNPGKPLDLEKPFLTVPESEVLEPWYKMHQEAGSRNILKELERIARRVFLTLERQWQLLGRKLVDFKIEFGIDKQGNLLVADVIDNDSWRLLDGAGNYIDKQVYRDGGKLDEVAQKYADVAALTDRFEIPSQRIVIWRGSEKDDAAPLQQALNELLGGRTKIPTDTIESVVKELVVTCSMHKEPTRGLKVLRSIESEIPDSVVVAFIGMSNGAGPTLSAHTTMPVINCPPSVKDFHEDVWSSLRAPSDVPCMTVLNARNTVHAACNILAARNPAIYAALRGKMEERFENSIPV